MSTWEERLARLADEQRDADRARANPHHGPACRTWVEGVTDDDGWGVTRCGPVINYVGGGTHGTGFSSNHVPPQDAIQFTREAWMAGDVGRRVQVYMTSEGSWEHVADVSLCSHGLDIPFGEWTWVELPLTCNSGLPIRMKAGEPFWIDVLPLADH